MLHVNRTRSAFISGLLGVLFATAGAQSPARPPFDLEEATVADLQQHMQAGTETSRSLVETYLARIDAIDRGGPALHSVIETNPDALTIADRPAHYRAGRIRPWPARGNFVLRPRVERADPDQNRVRV